VAISVLDVRDTFAPPRVRVPRRPALVVAAPGSTCTASSPGVVETSAAPRRLPLTVLAAGAIGILEAVGLMATALTGIDTVLDSPLRPEGWLLAVGLLVLAAWIVLCAGTGAALLDGAGRTLLLNVAYGELALVALLTVVGIATPLFAGLPATLPFLLLMVLVLAVPVGKLLLAGSPSASRWVAAGPRVRERRADPVAAHRLLATLTLGVIALALGAVAVLAPVQAGDAGLGGTASTAVFHG
jgi:hypothetical protein